MSEIAALILCWQSCVLLLVTGQTSGGNPLLIKSSLQIFMSSLLSMVRVGTWTKCAAILRQDPCQVPGLHHWYIFDVMQLGREINLIKPSIFGQTSDPANLILFPSLDPGSWIQNHYFSDKLFHNHIRTMWWLDSLILMTWVLGIPLLAVISFHLTPYFSIVTTTNE